MDELLRILSLADEEVEQYVRERIAELDFSTDKDIEISLDENEGTIYNGWINTSAVYLPSGYRSKGFKLNEHFFIEWVQHIRKTFGHFPMENIKQKFNNERLLQVINRYQSFYFGTDTYDTLRKEIYGYGQFSSIGEWITIEELKEKDVARCIEKSASLNNIANFMGIDSSLVLSDASIGTDKVGHAYCMIHDSDKWVICDPNFYGTKEDGKGIPFIFPVDISKQESFIFDAEALGDKLKNKVEYYFPWNKFNNLKK